MVACRTHRPKGRHLCRQTLKDSSSSMHIIDSSSCSLWHEVGLRVLRNVQVGFCCIQQHVKNRWLEHRHRTAVPLHEAVKDGAISAEKCSHQSRNALDRKCSCFGCAAYSFAGFSGPGPPAMLGFRLRLVWVAIFIREVCLSSLPTPVCPSRCFMLDKFFLRWRQLACSRQLITDLQMGRFHQVCVELGSWESGRLNSR